MEETVTGPAAGDFLNAVKPLDTRRRDEALFLLASEYPQPLTQYTICKTLVLADVVHLVRTGRVIFGGELNALPYGPVPERILSECKNWAMGPAFAAFLGIATASAPVPLELAATRGLKGNILEFRACESFGQQAQPTWESFSESEEGAIREAFTRVSGMTWTDSQRYFHEPVSAIGYAYDRVTRDFPKPFGTRVPMNWFDVLDGAEQVEKVDVSHARAMLRLWV